VLVNRVTNFTDVSLDKVNYLKVLKQDDENEHKFVGTQAKFLILEQRVLDEHRQHSIKLHRIYLQHMFHKIHIGIVVTK
jgi:hypothetical protein